MMPPRVSVFGLRTCAVVALIGFFVMPNLHGRGPDGAPFAGVAIRLTHGVAISWDGRIIRPCTSLSKPDGDGVKSKRVGEGRHRNHLYGTFTAAKERVVNAGRILSARALKSKPPPVSGDCSGGDGESSGDDCPVVGKKRRRRRNKKRGGKGRRTCVAPSPIDCRAEKALETAAETASVSSYVSTNVGGAYNVTGRKRW